MKFWHRWRIRKLTVKLRMQQARCDLLVKAEREYLSSVYTNKLHDAVCERVRLEAEIEYHKSKL